MSLPRTVRNIVAVLRENFATLVAGSLAYSAFMSVIPLLTLALIVSSVSGQQWLIDRVLEMAESYVTPAAISLLEDALQNASGRAAASIFSVLLLFWSGLRVFRGLDTAFSLFYNTTESLSFLQQIRDALVVLGMLAVAVIAAVGFGMLGRYFAFLPAAWLLGPVLLVVPLVVVFLPIYYVFPNLELTVREVLPGVFLAAIGWAVLQSVFQLYTSYAGQNAVYGTIGAVLLVLTWLYVASLLLLVGIAVNVVLADRTERALADSRSPSNVSASE